MPHPQITRLMRPLKLKIRRWSGPEQDAHPTAQHTRLTKGPMPVFLEEFVGIEVLPRRFPAGEEEQMVAEQTARVRQGEEGVEEKRESHAFLRAAFEAGGEGDVVALRVEADVGEGEGEEEEGEEGGGGDVGEEEAVVAAAHAVVEPDAVVVLRFDACVADSAVVCSGGTPDVAGFAVFCWDFHCLGADASGLGGVV